MISLRLYRVNSVMSVFVSYRHTTIRPLLFGVTLMMLLILTPFSLVLLTRLFKNFNQISDYFWYDFSSAANKLHIEVFTKIIPGASSVTVLTSMPIRFNGK